MAMQSTDTLRPVPKRAKAPYCDAVVNGPREREMSIPMIPYQDSIELDTGTAVNDKAVTALSPSNQPGSNTIFYYTGMRKLLHTCKRVCPLKMMRYESAAAS